MLKLKKDKLTDICVEDMKDGDIAVITKWTANLYIGCIVQRYKDFLVCVGMDSGRGWGKYFATCDRNENNRVRLLEPDEELVVG
jgi:hypothetical protein